MHLNTFWPIIFFSIPKHLEFADSPHSWLVDYLFPVMCFLTGVIQKIKEMVKNKLRKKQEIDESWPVKQGTFLRIHKNIEISSQCLEIKLCGYCLLQL